MSIYSELTLLFKLSQQINEIKEYENPDENDIDNIKELSVKFIDSCINISSITAKSEDEEFMRKSFLYSNYKLLKWILNNHCSKIKQNALENFLINLKNENSFLKEDSNELIDTKEETINNELNINDINKINVENENNIKKIMDIHSTIDLIQKNDEKYEDKENKEIINNSINNQNSNNIDENQIKENNVDNLEEVEEEDEEEEEEDDISELENDKNVIEEKKENSNFFLNIEENKIIINNNIDNNIINNINEEKEEEEEDKINEERNKEEIEEIKDSLIIEENKKFDDEKIILEKENKLKEMTNKTIKEYFEIFYSDNNKKEKFNDIYMNTKDLIDNYDKFELKTKEKIITFISIIFPFCSKEQKKNLSKINVEDENIKKFLFQTLLFFEEKYKLYEILTLIPTKNTKKTERLEIMNNLFIKSESELFALFQFLIIYKALNTKKDKNEKTFDNRFYMIDFYFISFKIYYILSYYKLYPSIRDNILIIYKRMLFIKKFYSSAFTKKIEEPYIISKINKFENEYKEYSIDKIINEIFDEEEKIINDKVIEYIKHFYKINDDNECDLLYYSGCKKTFREYEFKI